VDNPAHPQRRFPRHKVDIRVRVTLPKPADPPVTYGRGNELGQGGMAIFINADLKVGEMLEVELPVLASARPLKLKAEIRNRDGFRYGMQFMDTSPEEVRQLIQLCQLLDPEAKTSTIRSRPSR
jgi:PilZ domain